ncbi:pseudouridine synthase [bacterium]|jgi:23S rRNA pseudouridine2605 synthase|nr:pseudouridine synthase [bacterium]
MGLERVQKILAQAGVASRRKAEELIELGLVTVNGKAIKLGDKADALKDAIKVNGKLLVHKHEPPVYLAFHKPKGVISMFSDPDGRPTLQDYFDKWKSRLFPVGRLDFTSDGLILITNDGDFAEKLQRAPVTKIYEVKVKGQVGPAELHALRKGAFIQNRRIRPHSVMLGKELQNKTLVHVTIVEKGAIDLKALFQARGFLVDRITRVSVGSVKLGDIKPGEYRLLKKSQAEGVFISPQIEPVRSRPAPVRPRTPSVASDRKRAPRGKVRREST